MASPVDLTTANASFFLALLKKLSDEEKKDNVFFSPFSISATLAMVMLGAKAKTATQMSEVLKLTKPKPIISANLLQPVLHSQTRQKMQKRMQMQIQQHSRIPGYLTKVMNPGKEDGQSDKKEAQTGKDEAFQTLKDRAPTEGKEISLTSEEERPTKQDDVHAKFAELLSQLYSADASYDLSVANRLYGEQSFEFIEKFLEGTKKYYKAELEPVDFKGDMEAARVNINKWVEEQTQEKIKNLLAKDTLDETTQLVLVSAIYFKGLWESKFEEDNTVDAPFKLTKTDTKPVKMMYQKNHFHLKSFPTDKIQIIELPYEGADLSMFIILPDEIEDKTTGLEELEKKLTYEKFVEWTQPAASEENPKVEVAVKLPRFKLEKTLKLKDVLMDMGMVDAFKVTNSNFSGMSPAKGLVLSQVVHKSFVAVDEKGTEAAAATGATMSTTSSLPPHTEFIADHPFLFFIQHKPTKTVLFAGRYCSPE